MAEALAALVVLALAMGQVSEILFRYVGAMKTTEASVTASQSILSSLDRTTLAGLQGGAARDSTPHEIVIDGHSFSFEEVFAAPAGPCLFDSIGRRCR